MKHPNPSSSEKRRPYNKHLICLYILFRFWRYHIECPQLLTIKTWLRLTLSFVHPSPPSCSELYKERPSCWQCGYILRAQCFLVSLQCPLVHLLGLSHLALISIETWVVTGAECGLWFSYWLFGISDGMSEPLWVHPHLNHLLSVNAAVYISVPKVAGTSARYA